MATFYTCTACKQDLHIAEFRGRQIVSFAHTYNAECALNGQPVPNDAAHVLIEKRAIRARLEGVDVNLEYDRSGLHRFYMCDKDNTHVDYYRGEPGDRDGRANWKRCQCGGRMLLTTMRLLRDGTMEAPGAFKRTPSAPSVPVVRTDAELLKAFLKRIPTGGYRKVKLNSKRAEIYPKANAPWSFEGFRYEAVADIIADGETNTMLVRLNGCAGMADIIRQAAGKIKVELDMRMRPARQTKVVKRTKKAPVAK